MAGGGPVLHRRVETPSASTALLHPLSNWLLRTGGLLLTALMERAVRPVVHTIWGRLGLARSRLPLLLQGPAELLITTDPGQDLDDESARTGSHHAF